MNIEEGKIITLENDKEFICISKKIYKENTYLYLISNSTPIKMCFAKLLNDNQLEIINNQEEKYELLNIFGEKNN